MPPIYKQLTNLLSDTWIAIKFRWTNKYIKVSPEIQQERWSVCQSCAWFQRGRCSKCGCFMRLKTQLASAECPEHKWAATEISPLDDCGVCPP